eukprot:3504210-Rhodomonas_salina.1
MLPGVQFLELISRSSEIKHINPHAPYTQYRTCGCSGLIPRCSSAKSNPQSRKPRTSGPRSAARAFDLGVERYCATCGTEKAYGRTPPPPSCTALQVSSYALPMRCPV